MKLFVSDQDNVEFDRTYVQRKGLAGFVKLAWSQVERSAPYIHGRHIDETAKHGEALIRGQIRKLVINQPPSTTKSMVISVCLHPFCWTEDPKHKFIFASYSHDLAVTHAGKAKSLIVSDWYRARWPHVQIVNERRAADGSYESTEGGFRFSTSVRGEVTGRHAHTLICDDPHKPVDLLSKDPKALKLVQDWWTGTISTRLADPINARKLVLMQRLHNEDLSAYCIASGYELLSLPMRFEPERASRTSVGGDWRTEEGQLLFPERFPERVVEELEKDLGDDARAQLQQDPNLKNGTTFSAEHFRFWRHLPERIDRLYWSWDCTFKATSGSDNVCGQIWAKSGPDYYLLWRVYQQMAFGETLTAIESMARWSKNQYGRGGEIVIEDKANGPAVIDVLKKQIPGIVPVEPLGGKVARANAITYLFRGANVFFPDPDMPKFGWVRDHVKTLLKFPNVKKDDTVDAMSQALLFGEQTSGMTGALQASLAKQARIGSV